MNAEDMVLAKEMKGKRKKDEGTSDNHDKKEETRSVRQTQGKRRNFRTGSQSSLNLLL